MSFTDMYTLIPEGAVGEAEIVHDKPSPSEIMRSAWHGIVTEDRVHTRLLVRGRIMMTDARFERQTNNEFVREARGDILIAGLGIGLIIQPTLDKGGVSSITVVEKSADVITLVGPHYTNPKLRIIHADIYDWSPEKGAGYDTIYFDIWPNCCTDYLEEMTKLHRRFRKYLKPGGWMNSWCRDRLRGEKRRGL